jgi:hypothetical protein
VHRAPVCGSIAEQNKDFNHVQANRAQEIQGRPTPETSILLGLSIRPARGCVPEENLDQRG